MAVPNSFYEQFLNDLAEQMHRDPGPHNDPYQARLMEARYRQMQQDRLRRMTAPGQERSGTMAAIEGLGRIYGGGLSLALTGDTNPLDAFRNLLGSTAAAKGQLMRGEGNPLETGLQMIPARGSLSPRGRALHGEEVRSELLAKRKAKGPRKPGSGRKPKTNYPPQNNQDLIEALAMSVPEVKAKAKGGGLKTLLFRLGRNR